MTEEFGGGELKQESVSGKEGFRYLFYVPGKKEKKKGKEQKPERRNRY